MDNNTNFEISQELEQMRVQFSILSRKLEEQNIVTDGILRSCAREKMEKYNSRAIWWPIVMWIAAGGWIISKQFDYGMPQWSNILTAAVIIVEVGVFAFKKLQQNRMLNYNGEIKAFSSQVKGLRKSLLKLTILSGIIGYTWVAVWLWLFFSMYPIKSAVGIILLVAYIGVMSFIHLRAEMKALHILDEIVEDIK